MVVHFRWCASSSNDDDEDVLLPEPWTSIWSDLSSALGGKHVMAGIHGACKEVYGRAGNGSRWRRCKRLMSTAVYGLAAKLLSSSAEFYFIVLFLWVFCFVGTWDLFRFTSIILIFWKVPIFYVISSFFSSFMLEVLVFILGFYVVASECNQVIESMFSSMRSFFFSLL